MLETSSTAALEQSFHEVLESEETLEHNEVETKVESTEVTPLLKTQENLVPPVKALPQSYPSIFPIQNSYFMNQQNFDALSGRFFYQTPFVLYYNFG